MKYTLNRSSEYMAHISYPNGFDSKPQHYYNTEPVSQSIFNMTSSVFASFVFSSFNQSITFSIFIEKRLFKNSREFAIDLSQHKRRCVFILLLPQVKWVINIDEQIDGKAHRNVGTNTHKQQKKAATTTNGNRKLYDFKFLSELTLAMFEWINCNCSSSYFVFVRHYHSLLLVFHWHLAINGIT